VKLLEAAGLKVHEITSCRNYAEYQEMAESSVYISYNPDAVAGGDMLSERLGGRHHYVKFSFDFDEIDEENAKLADTLMAVTCAEDGDAGKAAERENALRDAVAQLRERGREECRRALDETLALIGDTPVTIDYTFCPRPLGLARYLLENGFNVTKIYLDGIPGADRPDYEILREEYPDLMLYPTVHAAMRFAAAENADATDAGADGCRVLAIGQKAAYFENTDNFVNVVEGGGMLGYEAVTHTLELMRDAYREKKNMRDLVQIKGLGCDICVR
jgi:hypothetical protein